MRMAYAGDVPAAFTSQAFAAHHLTRIQVEAIVVRRQVLDGVVRVQENRVSPTLSDTEPTGLAWTGSLGMGDEVRETRPPKGKPADGFPSAGRLAARDASIQVDHAHREAA